MVCEEKRIQKILVTIDYQNEAGFSEFCEEAARERFSRSENGLTIFRREKKVNGYLAKL